MKHPGCPSPLSLLPWKPFDPQVMLCLPSSASITRTSEQGPIGRLNNLVASKADKVRRRLWVTGAWGCVGTNDILHVHYQMALIEELADARIALDVALADASKVWLGFLASRANVDANRVRCRLWSDGCFASRGL